MHTTEATALIVGSDLTHYLKQIGLLDAPDEEAIDVLLKLATDLVSAPVALLSIIDTHGDRQFFKGQLGLDDPWAQTRQTPLSHSFCKHVVENNAPLVVTNSTEDPRVANNGAITDLNVIAYLGFPVGWDPENPVGAVCAIQDTKRDWTTEEAETMKAIASAISTNIQLRVALNSETEAKEAAIAAESDAQNAKQTLTDLANAFPGAIFQYIRKPDGTGELIFASKGCQSIFDLSVEQLSKGPDAFWKGVSSDEVSRLRSELDRCGRTQTKWNSRWQVKTGDHMSRWLHGFGTPVGQTDGSVLWNVAIFDVSANVAAEQENVHQRILLEETQRNESVARIAGGIAHHFNNVFFAAQGNLEALADRSPAEQKQLLQNLEQMLAESADLTKQLLNVAQRTPSKTEVLDVGQCIQGISELLSHNLRPEVDVVIDAPSQLYFIEADKLQLENAIVNMVSNAYEAIDGPGKIRISVDKKQLSDDDPLVEWKLVQSGEYIVCTIADSGKGIPEENKKHIFEPYFTTKPEEHGAGLGLLSVRAVAQQTNGAIVPLPNPSGGTSMKLFLSKADRKKPQTPNLQSTGSAPRPEDTCILFAEDHQAVREITTAMLRKEGFTVIPAENADEALEAFHKEPAKFDLVLTDVLMPGSMYGPQMVRTIRESHPDMPAIFVSGYTASAFEDSGLEADRDRFLTKAVKRADLLQAIEETLAEA